MKLQGIGRKVGALALAATLGVGAPIAANVLYATPAQAAIEKSTVNVTNTNNPNGTYNVYQFFRADINGTDASDVSWNDGTKSTILTFLKLWGVKSGVSAYDTFLIKQGMMKATDSETVKEAARSNAHSAVMFISQEIGNSDSDMNPDHGNTWKKAGTFANSLGKYIVDQKVTPTGVTSAKTVDGQTVQSYTGDEGCYLLLSTASTVSSDDVAVQPIYVPVTGTVNAVEKADKPTIDKQVGDKNTDGTYTYGEAADAEVGDEIPYKVTVTLPSNYRAYDSYYFKVSDTLPEGMSIVEGSVDVTTEYLGNENYSLLKDTANPFFNVTASGQSLVVEQKNLVEADYNGGNGPMILFGDREIVVSYKAKITDSSKIKTGKTSNDNVANYEYSNDPQSTTHGKSKDVDAKIYTFAATVNKLGSLTHQTLAGAEFIVKDENNYYYKGNGVEAFAAQYADDAHVFTTDANGQINIKGLGEGTYTLVEVKAPSGYAVPASPDNEFKLTLTPSYDADGNMTELKASVDGSKLYLGANSVDKNANVNININNNPRTELAQTGGVGVGIAGAVVLTIGVGWYVARNRKAKAAEADSQE